MARCPLSKAPWTHKQRTAGHQPASGALDMLLQSQDLVHDRNQVRQNEIAMHLPDPGRFDHEGGAASGTSGFGILPFVADDERMIEAEMPLEGRFDQETG